MIRTLLTLTFLNLTPVFASTGAIAIFHPDSSKTKDLTLTYEFDSFRLNPGESVALEIPKSHKKKILDFIAITHRQSPREEGECRSYRVDKDCLPAYTSVEILDANINDPQEAWRYWGGPGTGPFNSKFAEVRPGFGETDNLYEWQNKGHYSMSGQKSKSAISPGAIRIRSVGPDSLKLTRLVLKLMPPAPNDIYDILFSGSMRFGDFDTAHGRSMPHSHYGHALTLSPSFKPSHRNLPSNWEVHRGEIHIPLPKGRKLSFVDIAVGDSVGSNPGTALLSVEIRNNQMTKDLLMDRENVGSNGVMRATPTSLKSKIDSGDVLVIRVQRGTAYVMGIRLGVWDE